ncbi:MAG: hypothetical protein WCW36_02075 [Candidatus Paceibacterota bacterium]|jgi:hypothetical protein
MYKDEIATRKAIAAIVLVFPEITDLCWIPEANPHGIYAFSAGEEKPIYAARKIGPQFIGGVARLNISPAEWVATGDGVLPKQKLGHFWTALAMRFVALELHIPQWNIGDVGRIATRDGEVESVALRIDTLGVWTNAVVYFDRGLPFNAISCLSS